MTNYDTNTLNGSLQQLGDTMASNLNEKGISDASVDDGLTTLAGRILDIHAGSIFIIESDKNVCNVGDNVTFTVTARPYTTSKAIKLYKDDTFLADMVDNGDGTYTYKITTSTAEVSEY